MNTMKRALSAGLLGLAAMTTLPAQAGILDALFGSGNNNADAARPDNRNRSWTLHEFTQLKLVPRESGAAPNQHPVQIDAETVRRVLGSVRFDGNQGTQSLFAADELAELADPIVEAFANAKPEDDLILLSTSRRGGGILAQPHGVTARLFMQGGALQLIVHDARFEFMNQYIGSRTQPTFTFGSRSKTGSAQLRSTIGTARRSDWLALPTSAASTATTTPAATPAPAANPAPAAALPAPAAAPRARDPGFADEVEQRLLTLKRLRERGLISEEEFQQKRREILQLL
jgi:hypothetical protein